MSLLTSNIFSGITDTIFIPVAIAGFVFLGICKMTAAKLMERKRRRRIHAKKSNNGNLGFLRTRNEAHDGLSQLRKDILDQLREEPKQAPVETEFSYAQKPVMSETERKLFQTLREITKDDFLILTQVDLKQIIEEKGNVQSRTAFYKIAQKSIDFLLCSNNGETIAAIELQDWTHNRADRQKSDRDKATALKSARIPLIEFHAENLPTAQEAAEALLPAIKSWKAGNPEMRN